MLTPNPDHRKTLAIVLCLLLFANACKDRQLPPPPNGAEVIVNSIGMELVKIPRGKYRTKWNRELEITISEDFYMGRTEVTQKQYAAVLQLLQSETEESEREKVKRPSDFRGDCVFWINCDTDSLLVERVSWHDAQKFLKKLNEIERAKGSNLIYRLPTEAEWEYAYRAGTETAYYWGEEFQPNASENAWWRGNSKNRGKEKERQRQTHPVALKKPNGFGLYDMAGNLWEWAEDRFEVPEPTEEEKEKPEILALTDPCTKSSSIKALRGGSWGGNFDDSFRADVRGNDDPIYRSNSKQAKSRAL